MRLLLGAGLLGTGENATTTLGGAGDGLLEHLLGGLGNTGDVLARDTALGSLAGNLTGGGAGHCDCFVIPWLIKHALKSFFS